MTNRRNTQNSELVAANHAQNEAEMASGQVTMQSYPERLSFYWRSPCSLDCVMCGKHALGYPLDDEKQVLRLAEWAEEVFPHLGGLCLCPSGEPFESDVLLQIVAHAYANTRILVVSNGQRLAGQILDQVFEYRVDHLSISLNAARAETYQAITGAPFETLLTNLRELLRRRSGGDGRPHLDYSIVAMNRTAPELRDFVRLAADLGGERAIIRKLGVSIPVAACRRNIRFDPRVENVLTDESVGERLLDDLCAVGESAGIRVSADFGRAFTRPPYRYGLQTSHALDARPWKALELTSCGDTRFACGKPADLGNAWEFERLHDLWNGPKWVAARAATVARPAEPAA
ncbi:MAG: radical SAM protein [Armatimonadia bacterium]